MLHTHTIVMRYCLTSTFIRLKLNRIGSGRVDILILKIFQNSLPKTLVTGTGIAHDLPTWRTYDTFNKCWMWIDSNVNFANRIYVPPEPVFKAWDRTCLVSVAQPDKSFAMGLELGVQAPPGVRPQIARLMGPTWGQPGDDRTQVGPMLAPWTLLSGTLYLKTSTLCQEYPFISRKWSLLALRENSRYSFQYLDLCG